VHGELVSCQLYAASFAGSGRVDMM